MPEGRWNKRRWGRKQELVWFSRMFIPRWNHGNKIERHHSTRVAASLGDDCMKCRNFLKEIILPNNSFFTTWRPQMSWAYSSWSYFKLHYLSDGTQLLQNVLAVSTKLPFNHTIFTHFQVQHKLYQPTFLEYIIFLTNKCTVYFSLKSKHMDPI